MSLAAEDAPSVLGTDGPASGRGLQEVAFGLDEGLPVPLQPGDPERARTAVRVVGPVDRLATFEGAVGDPDLHVAGLLAVDLARPPRSGRDHPPGAAGAGATHLLERDDLGQTVGREVPGLERDPEHPTWRAIREGDCVDGAYCNLGILLSKAGQSAKAFDCFTKALQHNPRHFQSQFNLGNFYFEQDNLRLARMHYELAIELQPDCASVYFNLALVAALSNDLAAAIEALQRYKALSSVPEGDTVDDLLEKLQRALRLETS